MNNLQYLLIFVISLVAILLLSQRNLWLAILVGGFILSAASSEPLPILISAMKSVARYDILLLAIALGEIPLIGKILESDLTKFFNTLGYKKSSILGPAVFGLLPIPGGAVLSCPIIEKNLQTRDRGEIVAVNIWFRHTLFLIYPLSPSLIISTTIAGISIISIIPFMIPIFVVATLIGIIYYLWRLPPRDSLNNEPANSRKITPLLLILAAPLIQILLGTAGLNINVSTFLAVTVVMFMSAMYCRINSKSLIMHARNMKIWNFSLILLSVIFYATIFKDVSPSFLGEEFGNIFLLCTLVSFLVGFLTGRVQLTTALIIPIVLSYTGHMSYGLFVMLYTTAMCGYLMSPAHPCLVLSSEYFRTGISRGIRKLLFPALMFAVVGSVYGWFLHVYL